MNFTWEIIDSLDGDNCLYLTYRGKVIGGWIIRYESLFGLDKADEQWENGSSSMIFISDPQHRWGENIMDGVLV